MATERQELETLRAEFGEISERQELQNLRTEFGEVDTVGTPAFPEGTTIEDFLPALERPEIDLPSQIRAEPQPIRITDQERLNQGLPRHFRGIISPGATPRKGDIGDALADLFSDTERKFSQEQRDAVLGALIARQTDKPPIQRPDITKTAAESVPKLAEIGAGEPGKPDLTIQEQPGLTSIVNPDFADQTPFEQKRARFLYRTKGIEVVLDEGLQPHEFPYGNIAGAARAFASGVTGIEHQTLGVDPIVEGAARLIGEGVFYAGGIRALTSFGIKPLLAEVATAAASGVRREGATIENIATEIGLVAGGSSLLRGISQGVKATPAKAVVRPAQVPATETVKPPTVSLPEATKSDRAVFQEKNIPPSKPLPKSSPTPEQIKKAIEPKVIVRQPEEPTTVAFLGANPKVAAELGKNVIDAAKSISQSTAAMVEGIKPKPKLRSGTKAVKEVMIEHDRQIRNAEFTARQLEKVIADAVPDPKRQMLMTKAYENKLKGPNWKQLTKAEKALVRWAAGEKAKLNKFVSDNKIVQTLPESENFNHIKHVWQNPKTLEPYRAFYGKFTKRAVGGHERKIPTIERGEKLGLVHAETNLGKLIGLEWIDMMRAHQSRQMFGTIHGIGGEAGKTIVLRRGAPPRPIRAIERWDILQRQGLTDGYVRYSHPALDKTLGIKDGPRTTFLKGAVGVQEEIYPFVRAYIENPTYGTLSELNFASKSMKLGASLFHPMSLGMQELANFRVPFVNILRGLQLRKQLGPEMKLLHQEGLELFKGYEDLGFRNQFFEGTATLGKIGNVATKPISLMRDFIFDIVQPGMKTSFAFDQINKMMPRYLKGTDWTPEMVWEAVAAGKPLPKEALRAARDVVKKADGHFSGEHYKRSLLETNRFMARMYFSPEARKFWQAALLSPTWQREHLLVAKNVAKSFMPDKLIKKLGLEEMGPIKSQYRKYALGAVSMIGAVDLWNQMSTQIMDGKSKHIWENPEGKGFAVRAWWDEPSYKVIDKNGKQRTIQGGPAYIRPLKSVFEVAEWAKDPFKKFSYKLSPGVTAIGRQIIPDKFRPEYKGIEDMPRRVKDFLLDVSTPIVIDQAVDVLKGKKTPQGGILPFFGFPTSKVKNKSQGAEIGIIKDMFIDGKKDEAITRWTKWNEKHPDEQITGGKDGHINADKIRARELSQAKTKAKAGR